MADAGQDQEQGEFAKFGLAEGGGKTDVVCHLFEGVKETEDRAGGGFGQGNAIEITAEEEAQSLNARTRPGSDVGDGAVLDLAVFAVRLAKEDGRRGGTIGDFRYVHAYIILHESIKVNAKLAYYMTTCSFAIGANSLQANDLLKKDGRRSVG